MNRALRYLKNAAILTVSGLVLRAAGMLLRIFMAGKIGAEGMGLYQLVFAVYGLFSTFATSGISVAATRLTSEALAEQKNNASVNMTRIIKLGALLGIGAAALEYFLAEPMSRYWLGDLRATIALRILAFSLPFMAVCDSLKGYFYAIRKITPNVKAQLLEQFVRMCLIWLALNKANGISLSSLCALIMVGNTVSEIASCFFMIFCYKRQTGNNQQKKTTQVTFKKIWSIAGPVEGSRCMDSGFHAVENVLVPATLLNFLTNKSDALAQFGALKGMAMPILLFPFSFLNPLEALLLPEIAEAH